jgi:hypothetical protein
MSTKRGYDNLNRMNSPMPLAWIAQSQKMGSRVYLIWPLQLIVATPE